MPGGPQENRRSATAGAESVTGFTLGVDGMPRPIFNGPPVNAVPKEELKFPDGFQWGAATASYQIEGHADAADKAKSIWDEFSHRQPSPIFDCTNGDHACGSYSRIAEDVSCLKQLGCSWYRFSIAWTRVLPEHGKGEPTELGEKGEGLQYYIDLVRALKAADIEPNITLYHWDLPLLLEERGGWRNPAIVDFFVEYAAVVIAALEPEGVRMWSTFNEPWGMCFNGHCIGVHAPGKHDAPGVDPYLVSRHVLLSHARTMKHFRKLGYAGKMGIVLNCEWFLPANPNDPLDVEAKDRALDFWLHWFADPIFLTGDWPESMKQRVGERLPPFSDEERGMLLGSSDYFGVNNYSCRLVGKNGLGKTIWHLPGTLRQAMYVETGVRGLLQVGRELASGDHYLKDADFMMTMKGTGPVTDMGWPVAPSGLGELCLHIQQRYSCPGGIYISENGSAWPDRTPQECMTDGRRISFQQGYFRAVHAAIQKGADIRGFYLWSLLDNYEWAWGYSKRFGAFHVNFETLERTAKPIVAWYREVAQSNTLTVNASIGDSFPERPSPLVEEPAVQPGHAPVAATQGTFGSAVAELRCSRGRRSRPDNRVNYATASAVPGALVSAASDLVCGAPRGRESENLIGSGTPHGYGSGVQQPEMPITGDEVDANGNASGDMVSKTAHGTDTSSPGSPRTSE